MHCTECFVALAVGGFKIINGPPNKGKGPMESEEYQEMNKGASLPRPTQAGRIETCTESIKQAMRCLENNDKDCVMRKIEELVRNQCHDGRLIGKEVADGVREVVHELWLRSDYELRCELLRMLRSLDLSKRWVRDATKLTYINTLDKWLGRCGINWESKAMRGEVVKEIEDLLRRLGWSEAWMCEELFRFIGVDVEAFRRHGIEPCVWLNDLEKLGDLKKPYWFGLRASDLTVREFDDRTELEIDTTGSVDAVFFPTLLNTVKTPSLIVKRKRGAPGVKYIQKQIALVYYVNLGIDEWPWPIKLSADELEKMLNSLSDEGLAMFVAGVVDGDGSVWCSFEENNVYVHVEITACKECHKSYNLNALRNVITERFGIVSRIKPHRTTNALMFRGENAVRLLRRIVRYMHHPIRRLRAELILALHDGKISRDELIKLYEQTEYVFGAPDVKRNNGLDILARAAPQTHTHGG
ncbi:MAG: LAGLIDADG family homing endonuclease [Vulcanisaeta sp.]